MAILVTMQVGPVDWERFHAADQWMAERRSEGLRSHRVLQSESDPKTVLVIQEWDSHDTFHHMSERYGDEFNRRAGTEDLDWVTSVWTA